MAVELAKCLKLVAPSNMGAEQQTVWLAAAVDALEDIRPQEVAHISAEIRRSATRTAQIVPMIAELVAKRRARPISTDTGKPAEYKIHDEAQKRRAKSRTQDDVQAASDWEREQLSANGYHVRPLAKPLTTHELANLTPQMLALGLSKGFLERRGGQVFETATG